MCSLGSVCQPGKRAIDLIIDFLSCLWDYAKQQITREIGAVADLGLCLFSVRICTCAHGSLVDTIRFGRCVADCPRRMGCNGMPDDEGRCNCGRTRAICQGRRPCMEGTFTDHQVGMAPRERRVQRSTLFTASQKLLRCIVRTSQMCIS